MDHGIELFKLNSIWPVGKKGVVTKGSHVPVVLDMQDCNWASLPRKARIEIEPGRLIITQL
ncbi:hypothetical protein WS54_09380 [Burkholderia sp. NRF60-BP8]|nr:hypothetical protein WS54_09380 [Burkholderia sp. NRF60-BP8]KVL19738.1 hypothetical protein WS95_14965 [Burkholderia sp. MSMB1826]